MAFTFTKFPSKFVFQLDIQDISLKEALVPFKNPAYSDIILTSLEKKEKQTFLSITLIGDDKNNPFYSNTDLKVIVKMAHLYVHYHPKPLTAILTFLRGKETPSSFFLISS